MTLYLDSIITFGKHSGKRMSDVPQDYLNWLKENTSHKVRFTKAPKVEEVNFEDVHLTFLQLVKLEDLYRRTCAEIGRKLIYSNAEIPF